MFRYLAFCLPVRMAVAFIVVYASMMNMKRTQRVLAGFAMLGAVGFIYRFATYDDNQRGGNGGRVWWNHWRPVHATLYGAYGIFVLSNLGSVAPWFIVADTFLGFLLIPTQRRLTSFD